MVSVSISASLLICSSAYAYRNIEANRFTARQTYQQLSCTVYRHICDAKNNELDRIFSNCDDRAASKCSVSVSVI